MFGVVDLSFYLALSTDISCLFKIGMSNFSLQNDTLRNNTPSGSNPYLLCSRLVTPTKHWASSYMLS